MKLRKMLQQPNTTEVCISSLLFLFLCNTSYTAKYEGGAYRC